MRSRSSGSRFWPKSQGRDALGPGLAIALVGAHQHAAPLLAHVNLALEVDAVELLLLADELRHVLGDEVMVLHGEHRQFEAHHAADLAGPESAGIDHMFGPHGAGLGDDVPGAIGPRSTRSVTRQCRSIVAPRFCAALA